MLWPYNGLIPRFRYDSQTRIMTETEETYSNLWDLLEEEKWVKLPEIGCHENVALQQVYQKYVDVS